MADEKGAPRKGAFLVYHMGGLSFGLILIGVGVILLLGQLGIVSANRIFYFFWPAILIFFGVEGLLSRNSFKRDWGAFLTLLGGVLLLAKLGYIHAGFSIVWPLALIFWGLWLIVRIPGKRRGWQAGWRGAGGIGSAQAFQTGAGGATIDAEPVKNSDSDFQALFGSVKPYITSKNFTSAKLEAVFGEVNLDLTQADIEGDEAVIKADAVFGACEIRVPVTWEVILRGNAVLGEYTDKTRQRPVEGVKAKRLIVKGGAVFGGVVIRN